MTLRYTTEGEQVWSASRTNELGSSPADFIAVDGEGNSLVAGTTASHEYGADWRLLKRAADGRQLWLRDYHHTLAFDDTVGGMVVEPSGACYVTGSSQTNAAAVAILTTARYSPQGDELWRIDHATSVRPFGVGHAICLDDKGDVYVTANARDPARRDDIMVVKYVRARPEPEFLSARIDENGRFRVTLFAESGHEYQVESSPDLREWTPIARIFNATGQFTFADAEAARDAQRFYRAAR